MLLARTRVQAIFALLVYMSFAGTRIQTISAFARECAICALSADSIYTRIEAEIVVERIMHFHAYTCVYAIYAQRVSVTFTTMRAYGLSTLARK